jgi:hypothetical protein
MATHGDASEERAVWPYSWLFWTGTFGSDTRAGRALGFRTALGLLLVVLGSSLVQIPALQPARLVGALLVPAGVGVIVWAYVRYLAELDELRRLIQLEALALSYGVVMTLGSVWFGLDAAGFVFARSAPGGWVFCTLVLAEPLRGVALVVLARRRR